MRIHNPRRSPCPANVTSSWPVGDGTSHTNLIINTPLTLSCNLGYISSSLIHPSLPSLLSLVVDAVILVAVSHPPFLPLNHRFTLSAGIR